MASFGRLELSGITAKNENTFTLANFNIDFSLLKIVPPTEFLDVGNSLSTFRKQEAEDGDIHRTARKLGAIFEPILPSTPRLLRNYGTRASQIAQSASSSIPKPEGMFKKQAGIDGASIWAAATSSSGALQVHLLACMLARIWEQKDAISIWEELLKGRKMEIEETFQIENSMSVAACSSYLASLQTITRTQLGEWDDSARAWLRTADRSPIVIVRQNQLDQIVSKTRNAVNNRPSLYDSVIQAWKTALDGAERLLDGSPQQMQTGELLLGLNAWHMYPDINMLGDPDLFAEFNDPLVPKAGILTIGLIRSSEQSLFEGLHWSLPLAHLRYYGDPIPRTGKLSGVRNRISLPEFMQTILGTLFKLWEVDGSITEKVLKWILLLHNKLSCVTVSPSKSNKSPDKNSWLALLSRAAKDFLESEGDQRLLNKRLFNAGKSYGSKALLGDKMAPFFGLSQTLHLFYLIKTQEAKIKFLRGLMKNSLGFKDHLIIRYVSKDTGLEEFASVYPSSHGRVAKRTHDGELHCHSGHKRWINRTQPEAGTDKRNADTSIGNLDIFMGYESSEPGNSPTGAEVEEEPLASSNLKPVTSVPSQYESRAQVLESLGETVLSIEDEHFETLEMNADIRVVWGKVNELTDGLREEDKWHWDPLYGEVKHFSLLFGDPTDVALFLRMSESEPQIPEQMDFGILSELFQSNNLNLELLPYIFFDAVQSSGAHCARSLKAIATMHQVYTPLPETTHAIKILELTFPLSEANWVPHDSSDTYVTSRASQNQETKSDLTDDEERQNSHDARSYLPNQQFEWAFDTVYRKTCGPHLTKTEHLRKGLGLFRDSFQADFMSPSELSMAQTFSCILLFDSGVFNISPSHMNNIMAISSGDSLFIAAPLLSDPAKKLSRGPKIRHVMGNIGRAGTALLQAPDNPKIRKFGVEQWTFISGEAWDGHPRDAFRDTSLHLWFTGSSLDLDRKHTALGEKDAELYVLESVVSIHGRGISDCGEVGHWASSSIKDIY